jgi:hypothetical protein
MLVERGPVDEARGQESHGALVPLRLAAPEDPIVRVPEFEAAIDQLGYRSRKEERPGSGPADPIPGQCDDPSERRQFFTDAIYSAFDPNPEVALGPHSATGVGTLSGTAKRLAVAHRLGSDTRFRRDRDDLARGVWKGAAKCTADSVDLHRVRRGDRDEDRGRFVDRLHGRIIHLSNAATLR